MPTTVDTSGNTPYIDPNAAGGYVPPGSGGTSGNVGVDGTTTTGTPPRVGTDGKPILTYFNDSTVSLGDEDIIILNFLANIPAPGDNLEGGGGAGDDNNTFLRAGRGEGVGGGSPVDGGGADNVFLTPGSLVAFFMAYTEMANILRTMINSGAKLQLIQMAMGNELAKSIKEQKKISAESEAAMYIASAVANFADALGSAVNLVSMAKSRTGAAEKLKDKKANIDKDVVDSDNNLDNSRKVYDATKSGYDNKINAQNKVVNDKKAGLDSATNDMDKSKAKLDKAQADFDKAQADLDADTTNSKDIKDARDKAKTNLDEAKKDYDTSKQKVNDAQKEFNDAETDLNDLKDRRKDALHAQREVIADNETKSRDAHNAQSKFEADYPLQLEQLTQQDSQQAQFSANIITKTTQGIADLVKAKFALEKGLAEGQEAMLNSYLQGVNRQLESARDYVRSASDLSDKLQQALMKFSDDARKLGSSISVQSTG